jgi:hypothetical protein
VACLATETLDRRVRQVDGSTGDRSVRWDDETGTATAIGARELTEAAIARTEPSGAPSGWNDVRNGSNAARGDSTRDGIGAVLTRGDAIEAAEGSVPVADVVGEEVPAEVEEVAPTSSSR